MKTQTTYMHRQEDVQRRWHLVDAKGQVLGRLASQVAEKLIGKYKPTYTPHVDAGDHVVVINAAEVVVTGKKADKKVYYRHTGYPGGIKQENLGKMLATKPERVIRLAVKNMLPKNPTRKRRLTRLHVYAGPEHPHQSQLSKQS